jgi:hypothetical protein
MPRQRAAINHGADAERGAIGHLLQGFEKLCDGHPLQLIYLFRAKVKGVENGLRHPRGCLRRNRGEPEAALQGRAMEEPASGRHRE